MAKNTTFKILFSNTGYYTGLNGSLFDYFFRGFRYLYLSRKNFEKTLEKIRLLFSIEKPDMCCFVEIPQGTTAKMFTEFPYQSIENKYGPKSLLRRIPFFHYRCNGVFSRNSFPVRKHFLTSGIKKLVLEVELDADTSLFVIHASLSRRVRKKQFTELSYLLQTKKNIILCGDFNVFSGHDALPEFAQKNALTILNGPRENTFPSYRPRWAIDFFLCSAGIRVKNIKILSSAGISDHIPMVLEIER